MARLSHTIQKRVGNARQFHAQILAAMAEVGLSSWLEYQLLLIRLFICMTYVRLWQETTNEFSNHFGSVITYN